MEFFALRAKTRAPDAHVTSTGKLFGNDVRAQITEMKGISDSNVATYFSPQASAAIAIVANSNLRASAKPFVFTRKLPCAKLPPTPRKPKQRQPSTVTTCLANQLTQQCETKHQVAVREQTQREQRAINNRARFLGRDPRTVTLQEVQNSSANVAGWCEYDSDNDGGNANGKAEAQLAYAKAKTLTHREFVSMDWSGWCANTSVHVSVNEKAEAQVAQGKAMLTFDDSDDDDPLSGQITSFPHSASQD